METGCLQQRKEIFDPVICSKGIIYQCRQDELILPKLLDHRLFGDHGGSIPRLGDACRYRRISPEGKIGERI
jgi:hypothetical protein